MRSITEYLNNPESIIVDYDEQDSNVNEFLATFLCAGITAFVVGQLLFGAAKAAGSSPLGGFLGNIVGKVKEQSGDKKDDEESEDRNKLIAAKAVNDSMPDGEDKENNKKLLDVASSSVYDKDGNYVPRDKREDQLNKTLDGTGVDPKDLKENTQRAADEVNNKPGVDKELTNMSQNVNPTKEDVERNGNEVKNTAKNMHEKAQKDPNFKKTLGAGVGKATASAIHGKSGKPSNDGKPSGGGKPKAKKGPIHTGPKGGKYRIVGKHKEYIDEDSLSLRDYLIESMMD